MEEDYEDETDKTPEFMLISYLCIVIGIAFLVWFFNREQINNQVLELCKNLFQP